MRNCNARNNIHTHVHNARINDWIKINMQGRGRTFVREDFKIITGRRKEASRTSARELLQARATGCELKEKQLFA